MAFEAAIALFEEQRRALPGDEIRSAFLGQHLRPYEELLRQALRLQQQAPSAARATEVLRQLDRVRARALAERTARAPSLAQGDDDSADLRARLNWLYHRTQSLDDDNAPSAALHEQRRQAEDELLERARRQRLATAAHADAGVDGDDFDMATLCGRLGPHDALVEYGVQDGELFACVVHAGGIQVVRSVARWADVTESLRSTRFQIESLRHGSAVVQAHLPTLTLRAQTRLRQLHALVWAPLAPLLQDMRRVIVVPHGALGSVPFAALHDGETALADRHDLAMAASARMAARGLQRLPVAAQTALVIGESSRLTHAAE